MFRVANDLPFSLSRRAFTLGGGALILGAAMGPAFAKSPADFVAGLWPAAKSRGVSRKAFDSALGDFSPIAKVMELSKKQPEFTMSAGEYLGKRVTDKQSGTGRDMRGEWTKTLAAIAKRHGVQPEIILAIWGMETNYGGFMGGLNTVHSLATLTYGGYRASYFGDELLTALKIISNGHVTAPDMVGSWAGAMGHPQFMPSSFMRYAVDFKGDGHADIWNSIPDALASAANYLSKHGWRAGETWGYEVKLPANFDYGLVWSEREATLGDWRDTGVTRASGKAFPREGDTARLLMPMGGGGPAFAVLHNFRMIKTYNNSDSYALAVGHLADRIIGGGEFIGEWPNDTVLNKAQRTELQAQLARKGYKIGAPDGVLGPKTRAAIMDWQRKKGLLPDGHASGSLLKALS